MMCQPFQGRSDLKWLCAFALVWTGVSFMSPVLRPVPRVVSAPPPNPSWLVAPFYVSSPGFPRLVFVLNVTT